MAQRPKSRLKPPAAPIPKKVKVAAVLLVVAFVGWAFYPKEPAAPTVSAGGGAAAPQKGDAHAPAPVSQVGVPAGAPVGPSGAGGGSLFTEKSLFMCRFYDQRIYLVPSAFKDTLLKDGPHRLVASDEEARCLRPNETVTLAFVRVEPSTGVPYEHLLSSTATVEDVRDFPDLHALHADAPDAIPAKYGFANLRELAGAITTSYGVSAVREPLRVITFRKPEPVRRTSFGAPELHPLARTATAADLGAGAFVVDVRATKLFKLKSLPGTVSVPVEASAMSWSVLPYSQAKNAMRIDPSWLAKTIPTGRRVVVLGSNGASLQPYNFITYLYSRGYRELAYFRGGFAEVAGAEAGVMAATPARLDGVSVVDANQLRELVASGAVRLIDARPTQFYVQGSIAGAEAHYFEEAMDVDRQMPLLRKDSLTAEELRKVGESYRLPDLKGKVPLFFGNNEFDWRPLKAAVFARDGGMKTVYWYRAGFDEWAHLGLTGDERAKVMKNLSRENLLKAYLEHQPSQQASETMRYYQGKAKGQNESLRRKPTKNDTSMYYIKNVMPPKPVDESRLK